MLFNVAGNNSLLPASETTATYQRVTCAAIVDARQLKSEHVGKGLKIGRSFLLCALDNALQFRGRLPNDKILKVDARRVLRLGRLLKLRRIQIQKRQASGCTNLVPFPIGATSWH